MGLALTPDLLSTVIGRRSKMDAGLVALSGTVPTSSHRYAWPAGNAEEAALSQISEVGNPAQPILSGFSQGGGLAGYIAWAGLYPAKGALLIAPSLEIRGVPIASRVIHAVPTYILIGHDDYGIEDARRAWSALEASGVPVLYDERLDLGHEWPSDFAETLGRAINWIQGAKT